MLDAALAYREAGLSVIATKADKTPFFKWTRRKRMRSRRWLLQLIPTIYRFEESIHDK
jgi:hypothetical protein